MNNILYWHLWLYFNRYHRLIINIFIILSLLSSIVTSLPFHWYYAIYMILYHLTSTIYFVLILSRVEDERVDSLLTNDQKMMFIKLREMRKL